MCREGGLKIKQIAEERLAVLLLVVVIIVWLSMGLRIPVVCKALRLPIGIGSIFLDQFIEFAAVEPYTPTFRTVVDLNILAFADK